MITKRNFAKICAVTSLLQGGSRSQSPNIVSNIDSSDDLNFDQLSESVSVEEAQVSDDSSDLLGENITVLRKDIEKSARDKIELAYERIPEKDFGAEMIDLAIQRYKGLTRKTGEPLITEMLNLTGNDFKANGKYVPFCAAGLVYLACMTYCYLSGKREFEGIRTVSKEARLKLVGKLLPTIREHYFLPSAAVRFIVGYSKDKKRNWISVSEFKTKGAKKGWLVAFKWNKGQHIGLVAKDADPTADRISTFEFNTANPGAAAGSDERNGGWIGPRERKIDVGIIGFIAL